MISFIKGTIQYSEDNYLSVRVGNIAYHVNLPLHLMAGKTNTDGTADLVVFNEGDEIELYTEMIVRENDISLWGFPDIDSYRMFRILLSISGVGPKSAQNLVYEVGVEQIYNAIMFEEPGKLKISGIGLKTAQKIILELKSKLPSKFKIKTGSNLGKHIVRTEKMELEDEVSEALGSLGYREKDIVEAINKLKSSEGFTGSTQDIIKKILKLI